MKVIVDATPPDLSLTLSTPPVRSEPRFADPSPDFAGAFRRDDAVMVSLSALEPLAEAEVELTGPTGDVRRYPLTQISCDSSAWCGRVNVPLAEMKLDAFRGEFGLRALARDVAGNEAATASQVVRVTRWKWSLGLGATEPLSIALGSRGDLYVGLYGKVRSISRHGLGGWEYSTGTVEPAPALVALDGASGSSPVSCVLPGGRSASGLAQVDRPGGLEVVTSVLNTDSDGFVQPIVPDASSANRCPPSRPTGKLSSPGGLVAKAGTVFLGDDSGYAHAFTLGMNNWVAGPWPNSVPLNLKANGLALSETGLVFGAGVSLPAQGAVQFVPFSGTSLSSYPSDSIRSNPSPSGAPRSVREG